MKLFELYESDFEEDDSLRIATTAALSRVRADIEDSAFKGKYTIDALKKELQKHDVRISHSQLIELIKQDPWKNLISNIKGDNVLFKGDPDDLSGSEEPDATSDTLDKMADRSTKKHSDELK